MVVMMMVVILLLEVVAVVVVGTMRFETSLALLAALKRTIQLT